MKHIKNYGVKNLTKTVKIEYILGSPYDSANVLNNISLLGVRKFDIDIGDIEDNAGFMIIPKDEIMLYNVIKFCEAINTDVMDNQIEHVIVNILVDNKYKIRFNLDGCHDQNYKCLEGENYEK